MGRAQREKGKRGERKAAKLLQPLFPEARRSAFQFRGGTERADLENTGVFHVEVKTGKRPNVRDALAQAMRDKPSNRVAVAVIQDDGKEPFVVLDGHEFVYLIAAYENLVRSACGASVEQPVTEPDEPHMTFQYRAAETPSSEES